MIPLPGALLGLVGPFHRRGLTLCSTRASQAAEHARGWRFASLIGGSLTVCVAWRRF
jgi:hypothetical protein